jgi:hypothetical protein
VRPSGARCCRGCRCSATTDTTSAPSGETTHKASSAPDNPNAGVTLTQTDVGRLVADPKGLKGAAITIAGKAFNVEGDGTFQMWADSGANQNIAVCCDASVEEDQYVKVKGTVAGDVSGENAFGGEVSAPMVDADAVTPAAAAALDPAMWKLRGQSVTENGVRIRVSKIEFGRHEVRMYVNVKNDGADSFDVDPSPAVVSGGHQVETDYSGDYKELASTVSPGSSTRGVLLFKRSDVALRKPLSVSFSGYDSDFNELAWRFAWNS